MNTLNKNIKTLLLALTLVMAVGFSAFTNGQEKKRVGEFLVQDEENHWVIMTEEPGSGECVPGADLQCYYEVVGTIPTKGSYDENDIADYLNEETIEHGESSFAGLYDPD